jgi:histidinol dehydrogenase
MSIRYLKEAVPAAQVAKDLAAVKETVTGVIADIRERGDTAVREYSSKFDNWSPALFRLSQRRIEEIIATLPPQVITDIEFAQDQVRRFARAQLAALREIEVETMPGVFLGHKHIPVASRDHGQILVVDSIEEAFTVADSFAAEHVEVLTVSPRDALTRMRNYGALFLGEGTCVSYGDKVIGTNHVLPTRGAARYTGGLWVGKYLKTVTYQEVRDPESSALLGDVCGRASRVEFFEGHARSGDVRAAKVRGNRPAWLAAALDNR